MGLTLVFTFGMMVWIVLWSVGIKSFDAFLALVLLMIIAVLVKVVVPYVPGRRPSVDE